jgi:AraC-like DNA-binding protein
MIEPVLAADLAAEKRLSRWQDAVSEILSPLDVVCGAAAEFYGQLQVGPLGALQLAEITSGAQLLLSAPQRITGGDTDRCVFLLQVCGHGALSQDKRQATLSPGDFAVIDTTRPYKLSFTGPFEIFAITSPRGLVRLSHEKLRTVTATKFSGHSGLGALVPPFMSRLFEQMEDYGESVAIRLADIVLDLLLTAISQPLAEAIDVGADSHRLLMLQLMRYIETRLDDVRLNPARIAAEHHISTRYLHKLFREEGTTVSAWIRARRLECCRRDLTTAALASKPVSAIASRWGLPNPSHFSRLFLEVYGMSPTVYRSLHGGAV